uniref:RNase H type-1 domain-containing protein n=1 Tax=Peronospora matthiolae TaxID=2874970 RepID=A0AAV1TTL0_9STRA
MRGEIDCKAPGLQLLRHKALEKLQSWPSHEFLHMKREWNQSADRLASTALQSEKGRTVVAEEDRQDLMTLNRLDELLKPKQDGQLARVTAIARSARRIRHEPEVIQEEIVQRIRIQRIVQAQDEERWIVNLKTYLSGDVLNLDAVEVKMCAKLAPEYEIDENNLLFFCPMAKRESEDRDGLMRLVIPETLQQDFCITITRVWKEAIRVLAEPIRGSDRDFIGEDCIGAFNDMWANVPTVRPGKETR